MVTVRGPSRRRQRAPAGWGKAVASGVYRVTRPARDALANWRFARAEPRVALIRDREGLASYYRPFLDWLAKLYLDRAGLAVPARVHAVLAASARAAWVRGRKEVVAA